MSHLIDMSNYRANMAYVGAVPWHGLGEQLTQGAPIATWLIEAGMDYEIMRSRVAFRFGKESGEVGTMDDRNVLWRSDTKAPLAVVSNRYKIVQPADVLEFFRDLVGSTGEYDLETAGCLNDGSKYWALAKYRKALEFGTDTVMPYLLLATACDGSMATTAQHTSVRVVCNNTLQMSLSRDGDGVIKVRHSTEFNGDNVRAQLGVTESIEAYETDVEMLINKTISKSESVELLVELIGTRDSENNLTNEKNVKRVVNEIMISLARAPGATLETAHGTGWGLQNAVTHYVDFKARARSQNNRFNSGQFGAGAKLKREAFALIEAA
jgi:phage/plasmid-like protein (TIGR03299 family)